MKLAASIDALPLLQRLAIVQSDQSCSVPDKAQECVQSQERSIAHPVRHRRTWAHRHFPITLTKRELQCFCAIENFSTTPNPTSPIPYSPKCSRSRSVANGGR